MTNSGDGIDYLSVDVPDPAEQHPEDWHYSVRRADLLQRVLEVGHPSRINQSEICDYYGVSQSQISKDLGVLSEYIEGRIGKQVARDTHIAFETAFSHLLDNEDDPVEAFNLRLRYNKALQSMGHVEKAPDKHEIDQKTELSTSKEGSLNITWSGVDEVDAEDGDDGDE